MGEAGLEGIRKSVKRSQNTVAQYIATRLIMDLCERSTQRPGARVSWRWWAQADIELEGAKKILAEVATDSDSDSGGVERSGVERSGAEWSRRVNAP